MIKKTFEKQGFDQCKKYSLKSGGKCENSIILNQNDSSCIDLSSTEDCKDKFLFKNDIFKNSVITEVDKNYCSYTNYKQ